MYNLIGRGARSVVDAARKYRGTLAGVSALTGLQARLTAADATSLGITVLRQDASGNMTAGMFDLPTLHVSADLLPKSEWVVACGRPEPHTNVAPSFARPLFQLSMASQDNHKKFCFCLSACSAHLRRCRP